MSYPVILDLKGRTALVVGGGEVARRKVEGLLEAGAKVRLVAPQLGPDLARLAAEGAYEWLARPFDPADLAGCRLVIAATDDQAVNRAVFAAAEKAGLWSNVADQPQLCSFTLPALFRRGELLVTVSTGGASPLVAARLKEELAAQFGQAWEPYLDLLKAVRAAVLAQDRPPEENRAVFEAVVEADLLTPLGQGDWAEVGRRLKEACGLDLKDLKGPFE